MNNLPSGTVTFLFTDIEGSTQLWEKYPNEMKSALAKHDFILHEAIESNNGIYLKTTGDGCHAVFEHAIDSINAMVFAQQKFLEPFDGVQIKVRMGAHTGEAELRANDYFGQTLNRAARLMSVGHGGQILISNATTQLVRDKLSENIKIIDMGEHRLKDLVRPERIFQISAETLQGKFPPIKSIDSFPNNLPVQLTSFVGREHALAEAKEKLASTHLLTFIGPGGTGKTRLSLQLAAELSSTFDDGVWLVELAPLADPALILQTIASVLSIREQMGMSLEDVVANFLRAKNLLLVFDNCEHLVEGTAKVATQILNISPNIKVLASSREALGINGEAVYRVPSLSLPSKEKETFELLSHSEAVQLFAERAVAANPKFSLTEKNASSIAQICRRLDGIPLALELAAARVSVFPPEQISTRLDDRFKLLTGGSRTALPRQQTLRALIDWSYELLSEPERILLRRLSVFAGGWTFEAAEIIFNDLDVLSLLTQLVNKSLVTVDDESGQTRYRLLETIRQYARDKLLGAGMDELRQTRGLHLAYYLNLAKVEGPKLENFQALETLNLFEAEHDNFRAALEWAFENNTMSALQLILDLNMFWLRRGYSNEGLAWMLQALTAEEALIKPGNEQTQLMRMRANILLARGNTALTLGNNQITFQSGEESAEHARLLGDKNILAQALFYVLFGAFTMGQLAEMAATLEEGINVARECDNKMMLGMALNFKALLVLSSTHDINASNPYFEEGFTLLNTSGKFVSTTAAFFLMARYATLSHDYSAMRTYGAKILPSYQEMDDRNRVCMINSELAHAERYEGHYQKAIEMYCTTIVGWQKIGHLAAVAHQLECFAYIAKAQQQAERAVRLFASAEVLRESINAQMNSEERIEYEQEIAGLRAGMDEKDFTTAWAEGRAMSVEQTIHFALEEPQ